MRKMSLAVVASMLLGISVYANDTKPADPAKNQLTEQIGELLDHNSLIIETEIVAQVRFTLNSKNEIVVLSVETSDPKVERFVKSRLNYQRVILQEKGEGKMYTVPIRVTV